MSSFTKRNPVKERSYLVGKGRKIDDMERIASYWVSCGWVSARSVWDVINSTLFGLTKEGPSSSARRKTLAFAMQSVLDHVPCLVATLEYASDNKITLVRSRWLKQVLMILPFEFVLWSGPISEVEMEVAEMSMRQGFLYLPILLMESWALGREVLVLIRDRDFF